MSYLLKIKNLLNIPLIRHILAALLILVIGFYSGNVLFLKRLKSAKQDTSVVKGEYKELNKSYKDLSKRTDALQKAIIKIAEKEQINIENHIKGIKAKRGSTIDLNTQSKASLSSILDRKERNN